MQYLTAMMFEFHPHCNMRAAHPFCPSGSPERLANLDTSRHLTSGDICRVLETAWNDFGFRGRVGFHYYNEPMAQWGKLLAIVADIRVTLPEVKFCLWTNGTYLADADAADLAKFSDVIVTDYGNIDREAIAAKVPGVEFVTSKQDERLTWTMDKSPAERTPPCFRPLTELVVDYHGNLHICCHDWRGRSTPGNVLADDPAECFRRWQTMRDAILTASIFADLPEACQKCPVRDLMLQAYDREVGERALAYVERLEQEHRSCLTT